VRRRWPSCLIEGLELRHGGNISTVYEVRCAEPDQPVVVKIYPDTFHWKMGKELYVYRLLGRTEGLPTPSILWSDTSKEILPQNYVVMTTLKGQVLSRVESSLLAPELRDIYFEMGALLSKIHRITLAAFGYITTRITASHPTNDAYMRSQFQKKLVEFDVRGGDAVLRRTVEEYVETHHDLLTQARTPVLCHDDYHPGNVLVAVEKGKWHVTGVVDVENACPQIPCSTSRRPTTTRSNRMKPSERASLQGTASYRATGESESSCTSSIMPSSYGIGSPQSGIEAGSFA